MAEFLKLATPDEALRTYLETFTSPLGPEEIETAQAVGRINYEPIHAGLPLPDFPRSTVDGYAVSARDTFGASDTLPVYLRVAGEILMGVTPDFALSPGTCGLIHTGGMLPEGADSVIMLEHAQSVKAGEIEVFKAVGVGENVIFPGEDVREGEEVIPPGTRLRPAEIGGLMALGVTRIKVTRRPLVGVISSGDEVVPPEVIPPKGKIRDVNSYSLSALIQTCGGIPKRFGIVKDVREELTSAVLAALGACDLVVITAGSSVSSRDMTAAVLNEVGKPGVIYHGINIRPGKPTILAACQAGKDGPIKPVVGLSGNPVSALVIAWLVVDPVIKRLSGLLRATYRPRVRAKLSVNLASQAGREDWVPVRLSGGEGALVADPVFGKSNLIFSLARADGLVRIDPATTGMDAGSEVDVFLLG